MRTLLLLLCTLCLAQSLENLSLSQKNVQFSIFKDTFQITLPAKTKIISQQSGQTITIIIDQKWLDQPLKKTLNYPFQSFQITPQENQTLLILQAQTDLSYEQTQDSQSLHLIFKVSSSEFWWKYGMIIALLFLLIALLLYLKKRQISSSHHRFQMTQTLLGKDCKIITLENQEKTFTIFSDGKSCILLDSKNRDLQSKGD